MKPFIYILLFVFSGVFYSQASDSLFLLQDNCVKCHILYETRVEENSFFAWRNSVHFQPDSSCSGCHGGDPYIRLDFQKGHMGKPAGDEILSMCGRCHKTEVTHFKNRLKSKSQMKSCEASCINCHGHHRIKSENGSRIFKTTCSKCHALMAAQSTLSKILEVETVSSDIQSYATKKQQRGLPVDSHMETFRLITREYKQSFHKMNVNQIEQHLTDVVLPGLKAVQSEMNSSTIFKWYSRGVIIMGFFIVVFVFLILYQLVLNMEEKENMN